MLHVSEHPPQWKTVVGRLLLWQAGIGFSLVLISGYVFGALMALGGCIGVLLVLVNTVWMARVSMAESSSQKTLYQSAVLRYLMFFVVLLLVGWVGIPLLAALAGMGVTYLVLYFYSASFLMREDGSEQV